MHEIRNQRLSAIDIGSNAIRMLVAEVTGPQQFEVIKKFRAPVRLGHDVFLSGHISEHTLNEAKDTFRQFAEINQKYNVTACRAVATSATREAKNKDHFLAEIKKQSGIQIEVIDGLEEGKLIHLAVSREVDLEKRRVLLIDIGGGSVEITFSDRTQILASQSFPMGTVRVLDHMKKRGLSESQLNVIIGEFMEPLSRYIHEQTDQQSMDFAIGTGGNLECLGKLKGQLLHKFPTHYVTLPELIEITSQLRALSIKERIEKLKLKPDRADVILPAATLVKAVMRQAEVEKIAIPGVGLRDGILWTLIQSSI